MSVYMTEEEQLKAIGQWWQKHSSKITVVLSIILLVISSYKYWNWHQERTKLAASNAYEHLMVAYANLDKKATRAYANELITQYDRTVYSDVARLILAKMALTKEQYEKAESHLKSVVEHSSVSALKQVAQMRLARVYIMKKQYEEALAVLSHQQDEVYVSVVNELKGDIYSSLGRYKEAVDAYQIAIQEGKALGIGNPFLEMKSNELASLSQVILNNHGKVQTA